MAQYPKHNISSSSSSQNSSILTSKRQGPKSNTRSVKRDRLSLSSSSGQSLSLRKRARRSEDTRSSLASIYPAPPRPVSSRTRTTSGSGGLPDSSTPASDFSTNELDLDGIPEGILGPTAANPGGAGDIPHTQPTPSRTSQTLRTGHLKKAVIDSDDDEDNIFILPRQTTVQRHIAQNSSHLGLSSIPSDAQPGWDSDGENAVKDEQLSHMFASDSNHSKKLAKKRASTSIPSRLQKRISNNDSKRPEEEVSAAQIGCCSLSQALANPHFPTRRLNDHKYRRVIEANYLETLRKLISPEITERIRRGRGLTLNVCLQKAAVIQLQQQAGGRQTVKQDLSRKTSCIDALRKLVLPEIIKQVEADKESTRVGRVYKAVVMQLEQYANEQGNPTGELQRPATEGSITMSEEYNSASQQKIPMGEGYNPLDDESRLADEKHDSAGEDHDPMDQDFCLDGEEQDSSDDETEDEHDLDKIGKLRENLAKMNVEILRLRSENARKEAINQAWRAAHEELKDRLERVSNAFRGH